MDGIPTGGSPSVEGVVAEASLEVAAPPSFLSRLARVDLRRPRMHGRVLLSSYVV